MIDLDMTMTATKTWGAYLGAGDTLRRRLDTLAAIALRWGYNRNNLIRGIGRGEFDLDWVRDAAAPPDIAESRRPYPITIGTERDAIVDGLNREAKAFDTTNSGLLRLIADGQIQIVGRRSRQTRADRTS